MASLSCSNGLLVVTSDHTTTISTSPPTPLLSCFITSLAANIFQHLGALQCSILPQFIHSTILSETQHVADVSRCCGHTANTTGRRRGFRERVSRATQSTRRWQGPCRGTAGKATENEGLMGSRPRILTTAKEGPLREGAVYRAKVDTKWGTLGQELPGRKRASATPGDGHRVGWGWGGASEGTRDRAPTRSAVVIYGGAGSADRAPRRGRRHLSWMTSRAVLEGETSRRHVSTCPVQRTAITIVRKDAEEGGEGQEGGRSRSGVSTRTEGWTQAPAGEGAPGR